MSTNFIKSVFKIIIKSFRFVFDLLTGKHAEEQKAKQEKKLEQCAIFKKHLNENVRPALLACDGSHLSVLEAVCNNRLIVGMSKEEQFLFMKENKDYVERKLSFFVDEFRSVEMSLFSLAGIIQTMLSTEESVS